MDGYCVIEVTGNGLERGPPGVALKVPPVVALKLVCIPRKGSVIGVGMDDGRKLGSIVLCAL